jgi:L-seryl-tRNA(Ser) seleniumtransferase
VSPPDASDIRRLLPAVSRVLAEPPIEDLVGLYGSVAVTDQVRESIQRLRKGADAGEHGIDTAEAAVSAVVAEVAGELERRLGRRVERILNATGIFLHTNLGRAPLPPEVAGELPGLLDAYCDLEIERESGKRGDRNRRAARLLETLTGAEAALVANNNAAALVLVLATLALGKEVVVSRGELVEIGGSFRIPDILAASGARLVEVGSTNRTRAADYRRAIGPETALLLRVNPSNYRISGFTEAVPIDELVEVGRDAGVPVLWDEGSGLLRPHPAPQLAGKESVEGLLGAGCDLVCSSGDKLLGGPQAGLLFGRRELVEACHRHPLYRAVRPDRACLASLEAVLRLHLAGAPLPVDRLWPDPAAHRRRLEAMAGPFAAELITAEAFLGGGAAPEEPIPGDAVALPADQRLLHRLRMGDPPVVGYLRDGKLILDLRTVDPRDDEALKRALGEALAETSGRRETP